MVTIVAFAQAKSGKEKDLEKALLELVSHTRKEAACINYDVHRHLAKPGMFIFHENWVDKAGLEQDRKSQHIADFQAKAGDLLAEPLQIELCEMVSQQVFKK
ncbi:MAG: putative quinol monooxygenase [Desulfomonilaceae bacterium]